MLCFHRMNGNQSFSLTCKVTNRLPVVLTCIYWKSWYTGHQLGMTCSISLSLKSVPTYDVVTSFLWGKIYRQIIFYFFWRITFDIFKVLKRPLLSLTFLPRRARASLIPLSRKFFFLSKRSRDIQTDIVTRWFPRICNFPSMFLCYFFLVKIMRHYIFTILNVVI